MRNWEVGNGCHKRFYRHMFFWFIYRLPLETSGTASYGTTGTTIDYSSTPCYLCGWDVAQRCFEPVTTKEQTWEATGLNMRGLTKIEWKDSFK